MGILVSLAILCYIVYKNRKKSTNNALKQKMSRLWFDHVDRTSQYIIAVLDGLPSMDAIAAHLHENQNDIGVLMSKYYGKEVGSKLSDILHSHIDVFGKIVVAAKEQKPLDDLILQLNQNAEKIAQVLSTINPNEWPLEQTKQMISSHLSETTKYLQLLISKDWIKSVKQHDVVLDQAQHMADVLSYGIIKQFS